VGAATGRYTLELARRGYRVTAVDLTLELLAVCQACLQAGGLAQQVRCVQADARQLDAVPQSDFSAALLMGPLYHLVEPGDRLTALQQVYARLRPGGILFSSFISRLGVLGDVMKNIPAWTDDPLDVHAFIQDGKRPDAYPRGSFRGYFSRVEEIVPLHTRAGFTTLRLVGVEPGIFAEDESFNRLQGEQRRRWLDLLMEVSGEPSILGASRHLLYIGQKN
jgi:SAM-dependent methyltransferase